MTLPHPPHNPGSSTSPGMVGTVDHLRLVHEAGRGPCCVVFRAYDTVAERTLAAKVLPAEMAAGTEEAGRFRAALAGAAHLVHPRIVALRHLHEVWEADAGAQRLGIRTGRIVLLSDWVDGVDLRAWLAEAQADREALHRLFLDVASGLDAAHGAGIVHGALSPGNVLVSPAGTAVVADLAASAELRASLRNLGLASADALRNCPWTAPEIRSGGAAAPAADVYSLAALLAAALTGRWDGTAPAALPLDSLSMAQNRCLRRGLAQAAGERPASCAALVEGALAGHAVVSPPIAAVSGATPSASPRPAAATPLPEGPAVQPSPSAPPTAEEPPQPPALPNARAMPNAVSAGANAEPAITPAAPPAAPLGFRSPWRAWNAERRRIWLVNVSLAACLGVVGVLAGALVWRHWHPRRTVASAEPPWTTVAAEDSRLGQRFIWRAVLRQPPEDVHLRLRVLGQSRRLDFTVDAAAITARETSGPGNGRVVAQEALQRPLADGDVIAVVRTPESIGVYAHGVRILAVPWPLEEVHRCYWQVPEGSAAPAVFRLQRLGTLVFADDFMHGEGELGEWSVQSGTWSVHSQQNPIRSANPFALMGHGEDALATAGHWFWRDYRLAFAVHPLAGTAFGAKFCWNDNSNTYELLWEGPAGQAALSLRKVAAGQRTELARVPLPLPPMQWYHLSVSQLHGRIAAAIDGHVVLEVDDPMPLLGGAAGLWTRGGQGAVFDDVEVGPVEELRFDFAKQSAKGGSLLHRMPPPTTGHAAPAEGLAVGGVLLENDCVSTSLLGLRRLADTPAPLELAARHGAGEELVLQLSHASGNWQARILARGVAGDAVLATEPAPVPGDETEVSFHVLGDEAWGVVDGSMVVHAASVPVLAQGICAVRVPAVPGVSQRVLQVRPERALPSIENRVEAFTYEASMANWSSPILEWNLEYTDKTPVYWHQSDFWQDLAVDMRAADLLETDTAAAVGLALRNPEIPPSAGQQRQVSLRYDPTARELRLEGLAGDPRVLKLVRQRVDSLGLERRCGRLLVRLNRNVVWSEALPDTLRGLCQVGRYGRGNTVPWAEAVSIRAAGLETYAFNRAAYSWLPVAGTWEVTYRWQCDPRWAFYSGVQRGGVACNWNKAEHGENVTIEFFAGPKMDQDRGRRYEYAADVNAVIAADGVDITSGYSFMFGGWNDRGSQIVRGKEILGENRRVAIPRDPSIHRRWFYVKLRKSGDRLSFWVDGELVASVTDPQPLTGNRFGLWTWDNGVMVAQFRVSTDRPMQAAPLPATALRPPRTPYDR